MNKSDIAKITSLRDEILSVESNACTRKGFKCHIFSMFTVKLRSKYSQMKCLPKMLCCAAKIMSRVHRKSRLHGCEPEEGCPCLCWGGARNFPTRRLYLPMSGLKHGYQGAKCTKYLQQISFYLPTGAIVF